MFFFCRVAICCSSEEAEQITALRFLVLLPRRSNVTYCFPMESLLFLNEQSAKFMEWPVRLVHPRIVCYQFNTRKGDTVNASRFQACLVGAKPDEYVQATVPFSFKDESKPHRAHQRFLPLTCWSLNSITLDPNSKAQWNGCPNKSVVLLEPPTKINPIMNGSKEDKALALYIEPPMRLSDVLEIQATQTVDCSVLIQEVQVQRTEVARGKQVSLCTIVVVGDSNSRASVTCWEDQASAVQGYQGQPATFFGLMVVRENGEVRLNIRNSGLIDFTTNPRHEALSEFWKAKDESSDMKLVTPVWRASAPSCDGEAQLVCASFLRATAKEEHYAMKGPFQLMGVYATANLSEIRTKDGQRLYIHGVLRDWSGSVSVSFLDSCALTLLQCTSSEEVDEHEAAESLSVIAEQINVRGIKVGSDYLIAQISRHDPFMEPNKTALRLAELASLCGPSTDGMVTCAATQLTKTNLLNLAVSVESQAVVAPYRAVLLLQGSEKSQLITAGTTSATRIVVSKNVKCLLSSSPIAVTLRAYCSEDMLLDYKLDRRTAVVYVTAIQKDKDNLVCVVDRVEPLSGGKDETDKAIRYMTSMQQLSTSPRTMKDLKRALEFVTPESMKKARFISAYPSDPL